MAGFPPGHPVSSGSVGGPERHHPELVSNGLRKESDILFDSRDFHCI